MQNNDKKRLELIGITFNQIESGVYALILRDPETDRRLPIIIGYPEAQAIECKLQEVVTPRPLTHDMMVSILAAFDLTLIEVFIHKLPNGVFAADLILSDGVSRHVIDSRSSDAIALAIRVGAPIYTSTALLNEAAYSPTSTGKQDTASITGTVRKSSHPAPAKEPADLSSMTTGQLQAAMKKAVAEEDYTRAGEIKKEIIRRSNLDKETQ